jgi:hypothetical protein
MEKLARGFIAGAVFYGIAGIAMGLYMAISQDHSQSPTHAHINLIGWVSFFLFGLFYKFLGANVSIRMARAQYWLAQVSAPALFVAIWFLNQGDARFEPLAAASALGYAASFLVFSAIVLAALNEREVAAG